MCLSRLGCSTSVEPVNVDSMKWLVSVATRSRYGASALDALKGAAKETNRGTYCDRFGRESQVCVRSADGKILEQKRWSMRELPEYLKGDRRIG